MKADVAQLERELRMLIKDRDDMVLLVTPDSTRYREEEYSILFEKIRKAELAATECPEFDNKLILEITYRTEKDKESIDCVSEFIQQATGSTELKRIERVAKDLRFAHNTTLTDSVKHVTMVQLTNLFQRMRECIRMSSKTDDEPEYTKQDYERDILRIESIGRRLSELVLSYLRDMTTYNYQEFIDLQREVTRLEWNTIEYEEENEIKSNKKIYTSDTDTRNGVLQDLNMADEDTARESFNYLLNELSKSYDRLTNENMRHECVIRKLIVMMEVYNDILTAEKDGLPCNNIESRYYTDVDGTLLKSNPANIKNSERAHYLLVHAQNELRDDDSRKDSNIYTMSEAANHLAKSIVGSAHASELKQEPIVTRAEKQKKAVSFIEDNYSEFEGSGNKHPIVKRLVNLLRCNKGRDFRAEIKTVSLDANELTYIYSVAVDIDDIASEDTVSRIIK